jgi:hypothetical protein
MNPFVWIYIAIGVGMALLLIADSLDRNAGRDDR